MPQQDPYAVVIRLHVREPVDLALTQRARRRPSYEFARCRASCDIAIRPGTYRLEISGSEHTRAGGMSLEVARSASYRLRPAARDTLLPGVLLAALGPAVMGAGVGVLGAQVDSNGDSTLYWSGAGLFAAGAALTGAGFYLYADRPRVTFEAAEVPRERALEARPTVVPKESDLAYMEDQPVPPGYRVEREPRRGLLTAGVITFGISYGLMAAVGAASITDPDGTARNGALLVPVIGPLLTSSEDWNEDNGGLILLGTGPQVAGLALIAAGLASERLTLVPDVSVAPVLAPGAAGMVIGGRL